MFSLRCIPTLFCAVWLLTWSACGPSTAELRRANGSGYQTDFAIVYNAALSATTRLYPHLRENADSGSIRTAWHPLRISSDGEVEETSQQDRDLASAQGQGGATSITGPQRARKRHYVRFRIAVVGGSPWEVRVEGEASEWVRGAVPTPMTGASRPAWLDGRINALRVAIHRQLKKYAVDLPEKAKASAPQVKLELEAFKELPEAAAEVIATVMAACKSRDVKLLRRQMAKNFTWSLGASPGADMALTMWQANAASFAQIVSTLAGGCRVEEPDQRISCPPEFAEQPGYTGYRAVFERAGDRWQMTMYLSGQ